jgi:hypothetical protein
MPELRRSTSGGNGVLEMTNENFARLLKGLTIAVGNRKYRILFYQFLAAEIRALHYSYGIGDGRVLQESPDVLGRLRTAYTAQFECVNQPNTVLR